MLTRDVIIIPTIFNVIDLHKNNFLMAKYCINQGHISQLAAPTMSPTVNLPRQFAFKLLGFQTRRSVDEKYMNMLQLLDQLIANS